MKYIFILLVLLNSCATQSLENYSDQKPVLDLKKFFQGSLMAKGMVQDRSDVVTQRFVVQMKPTWEGNTLTLDEDFEYANGSTSKRIWTITETSSNKYIGTAADVVGEAVGEVSGNAFQFQYTLKVPVDGTEYEVHLDDWMYLIDENTLMAKSRMTKWGFYLGEVTLVMTKVE